MPILQAERVSRSRMASATVPFIGANITIVGAAAGISRRQFGLPALRGPGISVTFMPAVISHQRGSEVMNVKWLVMLAALAVAVLTLAAGTSVAVAAGRTDLGGESKRTEILFLGTAGGPPLRLDRSEPATLLIVDGRPYLIDCGIGTMRRMLRAGIESKQVRTIFFTHLHGDHDLGLADVMANDFFRQHTVGRPERINIYGPPQTKELVDAAFHFITVALRPFENIPPRANGSYPSPFVTHEFDRDGVVFQDDKIRVTAAENSHYALMPPQRRRQFKSFSYRIETPHGIIVFTGDTGPSEAVERLARGA